MMFDKGEPVGVALSWLAVRGKSPESVLTELGFRATGEQEEFPRSPATCSQLPAAWFAVIIRGRADAHDGTLDLARLSKSAEAVTCFVEEHVMFSSASTWIDGQRAWCVTHESERGPRHLAVVGDAPSHLKEVIERRTAEQDGETEAEVDFFFEVPVDLAERATGYRYDQARIDGVALKFDVLERLPNVRPGAGSWFKSILGRGTR